jgi:ATP-binding cassette subfamily F protein 3
LLKEYSVLLEYMELNNGFIFEINAKKIMQGLKMNPAINMDTSISELSGGEKTKLLITKAVLSNSELLLLDEPTNHLGEYCVIVAKTCATTD